MVYNIFFGEILRIKLLSEQGTNFESWNYTYPTKVDFLHNCSPNYCNLAAGSRFWFKSRVSVVNIVVRNLTIRAVYIAIALLGVSIRDAQRLNRLATVALAALAIHGRTNSDALLLAAKFKDTFRLRLDFVVFDQFPTVDAQSCTSWCPKQCRLVLGGLTFLDWGQNATAVAHLVKVVLVCLFFLGRRWVATHKLNKLEGQLHVYRSNHDVLPCQRKLSFLAIDFKNKY